MTHHCTKESLTLTIFFPSYILPSILFLTYYLLFCTAGYASYFTLMNSFNKTEAAVLSCRLCFLRAFPFISFIYKRFRLQLTHTGSETRWHLTGKQALVTNPVINECYWICANVAECIYLAVDSDLCFVGFEDIANCNKYKYRRYLLYKMKCIPLMIKGKCRRNKYNETHNLHEHLQ